MNVVDLKTFTFWQAGEPGYKDIAVDCGAAKSADTLGIIGHNLGTVQADISVESSDDGDTWTEALEPFTPTSDIAILKVFPSVAARYWRVVIDPALDTLPYIAVLVLGSRLTFPVPMDAPFKPIEEGMESGSKRSKAGHLLAHYVKYKPYSISPRFSYLDRNWLESVFLPFWLNYASDLHPFFWGWDLGSYPDDVRFVRFKAEYTYKPEVTVLGYYDSLDLDLEGVREAVSRFTGSAVLTASVVLTASEYMYGGGLDGCSDLVWVPTGVSGVTGIKVYVKDENLNTYSLLDTFSPTELTYQATGLWLIPDSGGARTFYVQYFNGGGTIIDANDATSFAPLV